MGLWTFSCRPAVSMGRQMLMLFNENVVNLDKFMNMTEKQSFKDIIA